jgi:hypothetical protein
MFTGALASSYYGRPRTTLDADIVLAIEKKDLPALVKTLTKAKLKVQKTRLQAAWESDYRIATVEDKNTPHTLDIIFTNLKLARNRGRILGLPTYYETADSLILAKLRMIKATVETARAATDREDIKAILESTPIDLKSLQERARVENTVKILAELIHNSS